MGYTLQNLLLSAVLPVLHILNSTVLCFVRRVILILFSDYPFKLELSSRRPDFLSEETQQRIAPFPFDDQTSSLSAFIMDEDYYNFLNENRVLIETLPYASVDCLMVLKAKAWLSLSAKKKEVHVDQEKVNKHKNDFFRLYLYHSPGLLELSNVIQADMAEFLQRMEGENVDLKSLKMKQYDKAEILAQMRSFYGLL